MNKPSPEAERGCTYIILVIFVVTLVVLASVASGALLATYLSGR